MSQTAACPLAASRAWVESFVVKHDICPFAKRELEHNSVRFVALPASDPVEAMQGLIEECRRLDSEPDIHTTLIVLSDGVNDFDDYLDLLGLAEALMEDQGYDGTYQLASFHPDYCFDGVEEDDAANYTNRSPWPMFHILREASIEGALKHYPDSENIPLRNEQQMRDIGRQQLAEWLHALR
ncbi:DUF1415 domain-containing protein [Halomonas halocynthiae]|uniref:DUF1415 domain-containing protein n=1 Tax=Halomonas halocynthiae TaxID=176290 RepID=UPI0003F7589A|nr:DUF1415 domain-containing protein [Halomonas halocynthiae]